MGIMVVDCRHNGPIIEPISGVAAVNMVRTVTTAMQPSLEGVQTFAALVGSLLCLKAIRISPAVRPAPTALLEARAAIEEGV